MHRAVVALILASMLAVDPLGWDPFGPLRWMAISTLALVAIGLACLGEYLKVDRTSALLWACFLGVALVSAMVGVDPLYAFVGTPDRHLGLFTWLLFAASFIVGQQLRDLQLLRRGVTVATFGIGLYTVAEAMNSALVPVTFAGGRLGGTFGQPAYLGAAAVLLLPLCVAHALTASESRYWRVNAATSAALMLFALFGSQTRGAIVATLFVVAWLGYRQRTRLTRRYAMGLAASVLLLLLVVAFPLRDRLSGASDAAEGRLAEWAVATRVIADRPLLGTGPEGYRIAFVGEVDAGYERRYGRETNPDRAHNGLLDVGVTTGVLGMVAYAALLFLIGRAALQVSDESSPFVWGIAAALVGYLLQQMLLFPLAELDPVFWLLAGVMIGSHSRGRKSVRIRVPRLAGTGALVLASAVFVVGASGIVANFQIADAFEAENPQSALRLAESAASLRPDSIRYEYLASSFALIAGDFELSLSHIDSAVRLSPKDPILLSRKSELLLALAQATSDMDHLAAAVEALSKRVEADPNNAGLRLDYGVALAMSEDFVGAEREWLIAADLAPTWEEPLLNLAQLELLVGS